MSSPLPSGDPSSPLERVMPVASGAEAGCVFCRVIRGDLPCALIHKDAPPEPDPEIWVFADINPVSPVHWLIVPAIHLPRVASASPEHERLLGRLLLTAAAAARQHGLADYRLITNNGPDAGQTVSHLHVHLLSGKPMRGFN